MRTTVSCLLVITALCGLGCDRMVVGETIEGVRHGERTMQVTEDAPPRAVVASLPADWQGERRPGSLVESDPAIRAQLEQSGVLLGQPSEPSVFERRPVAPPSLPTVPTIEQLLQQVDPNSPFPQIVPLGVLGATPAPEAPAPAPEAVPAPAPEAPPPAPPPPAAAPPAAVKARPVVRPRPAPAAAAPAEAPAAEAPAAP